MERYDYSADGLRGVGAAIKYRITGRNDAIEAPIEQEVAEISANKVQDPVAKVLAAHDEVIENADTPDNTADANIGSIIGRERLEVKKEGFNAAMLAAAQSIEFACRRALNRELDPLKGAKFHPGR